MTMRYNPPPNWPTPPAGWAPPPGWQPDVSWGPPPAGWKLWADDRSFFARHKVLTVLGVLAILFVGLITVIVFAAGTAVKHAVDNAKTGTGVLSHPEDFAIATCKTDSQGNLAATVTITNHSSKSSNYLGTLVWQTPDGKTQLDTSPIVANSLLPGQSTTVNAFSVTAAPTAANAFTCALGDFTRLSAVG